MEKLNMQEIIKKYMNIDISYDFMYSNNNGVTFIVRNVTVNNGEFEMCKNCSPRNRYGKNCNKKETTCGLKIYEEVCGKHFGEPNKHSFEFVDKLICEFEF